MDNLEKLHELFEKYEGFNLSFDGLKEKFNPSEQVSAIVFLASKLKDKKEHYFLHGEHDVLYIGSSFDLFEDFSEDDVRIAVAHGIMCIPEDEGGGFSIYASM